jgi:DNA modification methylase
MIDIKCKAENFKLIPIEQIVPNPKNNNRHSIEQINAIAKLIKAHGFREPLTISNRSGFLNCGHARLEAAKTLGMSELPVIYQDFASEAEEYQHMTADNEIARWAELDFQGVYDALKEIPEIDTSLLGIEDFKLPEVVEPQCDEDEVPEAPIEPITKLGDIYKLGNHRLMCGDSTSIDAVEKLMDGQKAELCFTSPPYADQRQYNGGKELSTEHLAKFISTAYGSAKYFAVNLGYSRKSGEVNDYWNDYINEARSCGLKLLSWNIWDRSGYGYTVGQATAMFTIDHEWIFVFGSETKELNRIIENKQSGVSKKGTIRESSGNTRAVRTKTNSHRQLGTVYRGDVARYVGDEHKHPAMFPVHLPESYIESMTDLMDTIYEPFGGSGTTMIAAEKLGRKACLMELDPKYCDVIVARWEKFTGKKAELINGC